MKLAEKMAKKATLLTSELQPANLVYKCTFFVRITFGVNGGEVSAVNDANPKRCEKRAH